MDEWGEGERYVVETIKDYRKAKHLVYDRNYNQYELLVSWENYGPESDTWEPLGTLLEDCADTVEEYLQAQELAIAGKKTYRGVDYFLIEKVVRSPVKVCSPGDPRGALFASAQKTQSA